MPTILCDREVLRLSYNGHNLDHGLHGPFDDRDTLQGLCDQGSLESAEKEVGEFESSAPWLQYVWPFSWLVLLEMCLLDQV